MVFSKQKKLGIILSLKIFSENQDKISLKDFIDSFSFS